MREINTADKRFHNGNGRNEMGTVVTAEWLNAVQDELTGLVKGLGGQVEPLRPNQIYLLLAAALAQKAGLSHRHAINDIEGLSSSLSGLSTSKANTNHRHLISEVTNLQAALNDKANTYHNHGISQVTGLSEALNGLSTSKANVSHQHQIADIQNLQGSLDSKASKATTLAGYGITDSIHFVQDNYAGDLNDLEGQNVAYAINHESNSNANFPPGLAYKWGILQTMSTGMFTRQIYYPDNPNGGIWTRNKFQSNDWDAWHRVDVSALFETVGDVTNLCLDPSLLEPKLGFTWSAGSTQGELVGGKNTRVVSARDNIYGRKIKVRDGERYYISCEYRRKQGSAPFAPGLYLDFDKNTRRTARAVSLIPSNQIGFTLSNEFERFEGYVDIPYGVETAQLWLQIDQYNTNATQYYVRNVEWRRMTGNVVSVLTGVIANGGAIPLPAGFSEEQCKFFVSMQNNNRDRSGYDVDENRWKMHNQTICKVVGRTVTATYEYDGHVMQGIANYLVVGIK